MTTQVATDAVPVILAEHPIRACVDLRRTFAGRFRFAWDEAYFAERPDFRRVEAPWLTIIPCRFGKIMPWGGRRLAAYCAAGPRTRRALETVRDVTVAQGGGPGACDVVVTFDVAVIETVAAVLRARRPRRRLTPEQRAALVARGRRSQFRGSDGAPAPDSELRNGDRP